MNSIIYILNYNNLKYSLEYSDEYKYIDFDEYGENYIVFEIEIVGICYSYIQQETPLCKFLYMCVIDECKL